MKLSHLAKAITLTLLTSVGTAKAAVLTFDDIAGQAPNSWGAIGTYSGFVFGSANSSNRLDWIDTASPASSWSLGSVSGIYTLLNNYGGSGIITAVGDVDFTFNGLWARTWYSYSDRNANIVGYNKGVEVFNSSIILTDKWTGFSGFSGSIDLLRLDFGNHFLVDNLALNGSSSVSVPEPASLALFGLGLVGISALRRRKLA